MDALVAAFQHSNFRRQSRSPLGDKQPAALCPHLHCSKMHLPDDCCICSNQRHPIARCWHTIGLPAAKVHMLEQFKAQQASGAGPWSAQSVKAVTVEPQVAAIASVQTPDLTLWTPNLIESGVILNKAEGNLYDVKEMDHNYSHGFKSSFLLHQLSNSPTISAIPEYFNSNHNALDMIRLPDDGPEVAFVSRVQQSNTVLAHVDTEATVMVPKVLGEIHGAVPTNACCGTAMTGSKATIDALGTWMVNLVVSVDGKDRPLPLEGTTQITDFQHCSLSLHALKELGFNCAHVLMQNGNFLKITMEDIEYVFPLLSINGGDYVEMRIHCPPPVYVAAYTVARLDLTKNFHPESLYSLLHLRYGYPGPKAMELILKGERTQRTDQRSHPRILQMSYLRQRKDQFTTRK
jgi:hypothetical protein